MEYQLDLLKKYKFNDIRLSLQYKAEEILKYLKKKDPQGNISGRKGKIAGLEYIVGEKLLGTGGAIRAAAYGIKKDFLVINGDVLTNINLSDFVAFYKKNISEPRIFPSSQFFRTFTPKILPLEISPLRKRVAFEDIVGAMAVFYTQESSEYGLVKLKNDRVVEFIEKPDIQYSGYINAGFYILSPEVFETKTFKAKKKTEQFSIERVIFPELAKNSQLMGYVHRGLWADIGSSEGLEAAQTIVDKPSEKE